MSSSPRTSRSYYTQNQRKHFTSTERRPRMLKDFLVDDNPNSYSSNGFKSFPRRASRDPSTMENLIQIELDSKSNSKLRRSRSKAASTTISAFQAIVNTVKNIHLSAVKSQSILPRSLSRRLSRRIDNEQTVTTTNKSQQTQHKESEIKLTVRVKDILRWKSFRDLVEEKSPPSDSPSSPHHCTTTTKASGSTTPTTNSNRSSWCDSDFTSECLPSWTGNSEGFNGENDSEPGGKKFYLPRVGSDAMDATTESAAKAAVGPKELSCADEKEQQSPISVLDFQFEADEDSFSYFNMTFDNTKKANRKCMENINCDKSPMKLNPINLEEWMSVEENNGYKGDDDFDGNDEEDEQEEDYQVIDEEEEKAGLLLDHFKATCSSWSPEDLFTKRILLDFFKEELSTTIDITKNNEIIKHAKTWINGDVTNGKATCVVRDMEKKGKWSKFGEEEEELALSLEKVMLNVLVDEVLEDLLSC